MKKEEQGNMGVNRRSHSLVWRQQESLPRGNRSYFNCVSVRQEVDMRMKFPCTAHSLLSRDPDAEIHFSNPGPPPGRTMSLAQCLADA